MSRYTIFVITMFLLILFPPSAQSQTSESEQNTNDTKLARAAFLDLVGYSKLQPVNQEIVHLYREVEITLAPIAKRLRSYSLPYYPGYRSGETHETPEVYADRLAKKSDWIQLYYAAAHLRSDLLRQQIVQVTPLIRQDLRDTRPDAQLRGLEAVSSLQLTGLFDDVITLYLKPGNLRVSQQATSALWALNDPRTLDRILPLLQNPSLPENYFQLMQTFLKGRATPASLLHCLSSDDLQLRRNALMALAFSGDPKLVHYVLEGIRDRDEQIRLNSAFAGMSLTGRAKQQVYPAILTLLHDPNVENRLSIACLLAEKNDAACAPTVLELLHNESIGQGAHSNVVRAMRELAASDFGYDLSDWKPTTPRNSAAIAKFADWVKARAALGNRSSSDTDRSIRTPCINHEYPETRE